MRTEKEGVFFLLDNFGDDPGSQEVKFTEKNTDGSFNPGTTNEEVIQMLIDRFYFLQGSNWSSENATIILMLKSVRKLLGKRLSKKIGKVKRYNEHIAKDSNTDYSRD